MFRIAANVTALALVLTLTVPLSLLAQTGDGGGRTRERAPQAFCLEGQTVPALAANQAPAANIGCQ